MKKAAIAVGALAVAALGFFAWRAHRRATSACVTAGQAAAGTSPDVTGPASSISLTTTGPATSARRGRGAF